MTAHPDLERRIADFYAGEAPQQAPEWLLPAALATIDTTHQRRRLIRVPLRFPIMNGYTKVAVAAVAVVAVGAVGVAVLRPGQGPGVGPSAGPSSSPVETPGALPPSGQLQAGTYTLGNAFSKAITFEVPDGWTACSEGPQERRVCGPPSDDYMPGVGFLVVQNVVADPCSSTALDPPVGPSVDDLVAALSGLEGFQATAAVDVSIDGYQGKQFELLAPNDDTCNRRTWITASGANGVGPGEVNQLRILDVDDTRLVITGTFGGSQAARPIVEQSLDSVRIGP